MGFIEKIQFYDIMKISVVVKSNARTSKIEKTDDGCFKIWVKETPIEGKANEAVVKMLAEYFDVARSRVDIISGHTAKKKIIEII